VYQGSVFNAYDTAQLQNLGVTHIIDCCKASSKPQLNVKYLHVSIDDDDVIKCEEYFEEGFKFLGNS
jgi:hypothetical protein